MEPENMIPLQRNQGKIFFKKIIYILTLNNGGKEKKLIGMGHRCRRYKKNRELEPEW